MCWTSGVLADGPISFRGCDDIVQMEPKEFYRLLSSSWHLLLVVTTKYCPLSSSPISEFGYLFLLGLTMAAHGSSRWHRKSKLMPLTIDLAAFGPIHYRYSGLLDGPLQPLPENQRLHLAYQNEIPHGITIKLVVMSALYTFHCHLVFPKSTESAENLLELSSTEPLAIVVYANASNAFFAVACGYCFGQGWVHLICDEQPNTPLFYAKQIYKQILNRGAEQAHLMAEACSGKVAQPFYVKHGHLLGTTWAVRVACGGWPLQGTHMGADGTKSSADTDIPCLMREILWFHGHPDGHWIESRPEVFSLAPTQQQIKVGDYGVVSCNNVGYFECRGNIFNEVEASKLKVRRYTDALPLKREVTSRFIPYSTLLTSPSQDAGQVLQEPKIHSLLNTQCVLDFLKQLSPWMRDYSLVTSVVECSRCSLTDNFKMWIEKQMQQYPKMWQGREFSASIK
ncbi:hypothetical protein F5141DRAFT_1065841 [Pisolithus sp. B1]|nr:hypothetical protein F5141DRAFT_1065841 [Pisolithus sp. B1]